MVASHTWHPGTGRIASRWPVPVPLEADELLSTWLVRVALSQGCDPLALTGELWPKWRVWTLDLDRGVATERLRILERMSGIDMSALDAASLRTIAMAIGTAVPGDVAVVPWILALGSRNRQRHGGLQYCPQCFGTDKSPFYRLQWRLAWHNCCHVHSAALLDRCCHCAAPVEPHRLSPPTGLLNVCSSCGYDLRACHAMAADAGAMAFQITADDVVSCGYGKYGEFTLATTEWFLLSRYFLMLLRVAIRNSSSNLASCLVMLGADIPGMRPSLTGLGFELLPVGERAVFLAGTGKLLAAGPKRLLETAQALSLSSATLRQCLSNLPVHIRDIVDALPKQSRSRKSNSKTAEIAPLPRQTVTRIWARLQRKMRRIS
ncbi:TniQ family protein [Janthinobacterium sp. PAMC25594]|uniref:TniQ family protein n=1 Tax=Janthinobacterium sp. PAMC25594 TaxID=2861284 RepID=UPI001C624966|nr:TniQ family protein [Janthinobacterium sp. PAMC25594]QYG09831.1 TniQ family protein [Janthinobacterium sp. PAMC25594]